MAFKGGAPRGRRTDGVVNTYGLEQSQPRYRLNGLNLLTRVPKGIVPTAEGWNSVASSGQTRTA